MIVSPIISYMLVKSEALSLPCRTSMESSRQSVDGIRGLSGNLSCTSERTVNAPDMLSNALVSPPRPLSPWDALGAPATGTEEVAVGCVTIIDAVDTLAAAQARADAAALASKSMLQQMLGSLFVDNACLLGLCDLAEGGFATVQSAKLRHANGMKQIVAVKKLKSHLITANDLTDFIRVRSRSAASAFVCVMKLNIFGDTLIQQISFYAIE